MRKLLVVVGAGASIDFGMPSVAAVGDILSQAAQKHFPLLDEPNTNLYNYLAKEIETYWSSFSKPALMRKPHFENVLYALLGIISAYPHGNYTSPLGALVSPKPLPDIKWLGKSVRKVDGSILSELLTSSVDTIINDLRNRCRGLKAVHSTELADMQTLLAALTVDFDVSVITLNYDDVVYRCMSSNPVTGFDSKGVFNDSLILGRSAWPCFLHLHGSVHFDMRHQGQELHAVHWQDNLSAKFNQNAAGRSKFYSDEGMAFPHSVIVAGHGKTSQLLRRPFRTYYSEVDRLVASSDALLCLGYGFGDEHLNMALRGYCDARSRRVVLIDWAERGKMSAAYADWDHPRRTVLEAMLTLAVRGHSMTAMGHTSPTEIDGLIDTKSFDLNADPTKPVAIWYNGMIAACRHPDLVLAQLR